MENKTLINVDVVLSSEVILTIKGYVYIGDICVPSMILAVVYAVSYKARYINLKTAA